MRFLRDTAAVCLTCVGVLAIEYAFFFVGTTGNCGGAYRPGTFRFQNDVSGPLCPAGTGEQFAVGAAGFVALVVAAPLVYALGRNLADAVVRGFSLAVLNLAILMPLAMAAAWIVGGASPGGSGIGGGLIVAAVGVLSLLFVIAPMIAGALLVIRRVLQE